MNISGIEKITKNIRISSDLNANVMEIIWNDGFDNISKGYEYLIKIGVEIHQHRVRLESDPELESKIKGEFQEMIEKITDEKAMFCELEKISSHKIDALKMLFSMEQEKRYREKKSNS